MRSFFSLILASYLALTSAPFLVMAAGEDLTKACPFLNSYTIIINTDLADATLKGESGYGTNTDEIAADEEAQLKVYEEWLQEDGKITYDENTCGKPNLITGFIEKGDCNADGKIITEITEVIAPDVELNEDANLDGEPDHEIITVYSGICCTLTKTDQNGNFISCADSVNLYTESYDTCNEKLQNCGKRQWVIGSSGIGLVKLMVKQIFTFGALSVGSIAVGNIVFQGIKISVSGVSGDISDSKTKILQAIGGIVLLFLSGLILLAINPEFFG